MNEILQKFKTFEDDDLSRVESSWYENVRGLNSYPDGRNIIRSDFQGGGELMAGSAGVELGQFQQSLLHEATVSDLGTPSGRLYAKMAAVVGAENILPYPTGFSSEGEKKRWLKSNSNALLYFYYKSPKVRRGIQQRLDRSCWYYMCRGDSMVCDGGDLCGLCLCFIGLMFTTPALLAMTVTTLFQNDESKAADGIFSYPLYYQSEEQRSKYLYEADWSSCCGPTHLSHQSLSTLYQEVVKQPIIDAGFNFDSSFGQGILSNACCQIPALSQHSEVNDYFLTARFGKFAPKNNKSASKKRIPAALQEYNDDGQLDQTLPNLKELKEEGDEGKGAEVLLEEEVALEENTRPLQFYQNQYGERELPLDDCREEALFAALSLKSLDYVIETHNKKWGSVKPINPYLLNLSYIFPGQEEQPAQQQVLEIQLDLDED